MKYGTPRACAWYLNYPPSPTYFDIIRLRRVIRLLPVLVESAVAVPLSSAFILLRRDTLVLGFEGIVPAKADKNLS
jgi:hypothetical protein